MMNKLMCLMGFHRFQDCHFEEDQTIKSVCVFCGKELKKPVILYSDCMKVQSETWMPYRK